MINVQPSSPDCVAATQLRIEFEQSDLDVISKYLNMDSKDLTCDPHNHLAYWALNILGDWLTERGATVNIKDNF